jgi:hypothetical protein
MANRQLRTVEPVVATHLIYCCAENQSDLLLRKNINVRLCYPDINGCIVITNTTFILARGERVRRRHHPLIQRSSLPAIGSPRPQIPPQPFPFHSFPARSGGWCGKPERETERGQAAGPCMYKKIQCTAANRSQCHTHTALLPSSYPLKGSNESKFTPNTRPSAGC